MLKTESNPLGLPKSVFDDLQAQLQASRSQFYWDLPAGPFYGFNRPGVKTLTPVVAKLVATRHDGRSQGALRRDRGVLADGSYART